MSAADLTEPSETFLTANEIGSAPKHLRPLLRKISGKVHAAFDRKTREVHVNPEIDHLGRKAFIRLHETTHGLLPWQNFEGGSVGFADDQLSLSPRTKALFEREANQGAAELLFQRTRFTEAAAQFEVGLAPVVELAAEYGASQHASFRRYVETHRGALAGVVLRSRPISDSPLAFQRREAMCSEAWAERFEDPFTWPKTLRIEPFTFVEQARACISLGSPEGAWSHIDLNNEVTTLRVEAMTNTYNIFVLVWLPERQILKRRRTLASAA